MSEGQGRAEPLGYLLDTSILLETLRITPDMAVTRWMESVEQDKFYVSALTIGELMAALDTVEDTERRTMLMRWVLTDLQGWFRGHILAFTPEVSAFWGSLAGKINGAEGVVSGMQAAFALKHNLYLVTKEAVSAPQLQVVNPFLA